MNEPNNTYFESIKPIRNKMRKFNYYALLIKLSSYLTPSDDNNHSKFYEKLPWVAEKITVWLLADNSKLYNYIKPTDKDLIDLINAAWQMGDELIQPINNYNSELYGHFLRPFMLPQLSYQQGKNKNAFFRQIKLVQKLDTQSNLYNYLCQKLGMPIDTFFEIAIIIWANMNINNNLDSIFEQDELNIFHNETVQTIDKAKIIIKKNRNPSMNEWYLPTPLYKCPLISIGGDIYSFGDTNLSRYFEYKLPDLLDEKGNEEHKQKWEILFTNYIEDVLRISKRPTLNENEIKSALRLQGKVCDFLVEEDNCVLFIEVKHKFMTQNVPAYGTSYKLKSKLKSTVVKGVSQLEETMKVASTHPRFKGKNFYSAIITYGDLWLGQGECLNVEDINKHTIFSADDLEDLCELIKLNKSSFYSFFKDLHDRNQDITTKIYSPTQMFMEEKYRLDHIPAHLSDASNYVFQKIKRRLDMKSRFL